MTASSHIACGRHDELVRQGAQNEALARQVADAVDKLCRTVETHCTTDGHPLLAVRVATLEKTQEKHLTALEAVTANLRENTAAIKSLREEQEQIEDDRQGDREDRRSWLTRRATIIVACIMAGAPLVTAAAAWYVAISK